MQEFPQLNLNIILPNQTELSLYPVPLYITHDPGVNCHAIWFLVLQRLDTLPATYGPVGFVQIHFWKSYMLVVSDLDETHPLTWWSKSQAKAQLVTAITLFTHKQ